MQASKREDYCSKLLREPTAPSLSHQSPFADVVAWEGFTYDTFKMGVTRLTYDAWYSLIALKRVRHVDIDFVCEDIENNLFWALLSNADIGELTISTHRESDEFRQGGFKFAAYHGVHDDDLSAPDEYVPPNTRVVTSCGSDDLCVHTFLTWPYVRKITLDDSYGNLGPNLMFIRDHLLETSCEELHLLSWDELTYDEEEDDDFCVPRVLLDGLHQHNIRTLVLAPPNVDQHDHGNKRSNIKQLICTPTECGVKRLEIINWRRFLTSTPVPVDERDLIEGWRAVGCELQLS